MRSLVFSVSLVICLSLTGQDYKPLVNHGNSWATVGWSWGWAWTDYYYFSGDTIINNVSYVKLFMTSDSSFQDPGYYRGAIREDTLEKAVYYYESEYSGENLLYKFGLNTGDTVTVWSSACGEMIINVLNVDTIIDLMGQDRRRMEIELWMWDKSWYEEYWIEGIGSSLGLTTAANFECIADLNFETLCFSNDGVLYYMNPLYDTCYMTSVGFADHERPSDEIRIIPNPVSGTSIVEIEGEEKIVEMIVYDSNGNMITRLSYSDPVIQRDLLSPGLFILKVITEKGNILTSKFIVN